MMVQIGQVASGCVRILIYLFMIAEVLHIDKPKRNGIIAGIVAGILIGAGVHALGDNSVFLQYGCEIFVAALLVERFQKGPKKMCLFVSFYVGIVLALCEFLVGATAGIILHDQRFLQRNCLQGSLAGWVTILFAILIVFLLAFKKFDEINKPRLIFVTCFLLLFAIVSLAEQKTIEIPQEDLIMWVIFAMNLLGGILVFNMNKQYKIEKQLAELSAQQAALLEKDYTDLNNAYAMNAKLFHDFHNHIGMLRQLVTSEKYADAVSYLDELQAPIHEMTNAKWTGEQTVDYLINEKIALANEHGIAMQVEVEYPNHSNIKSVDMCAIIGNLLDNALEAAKQVPQEKDRYIQFVIRRINQMLVIKVENSFSKNVIQENGELQTTKTEGGLHGWGMKSVKTAVDKYEGTVQHSQENQKFKVVATLSFEGVEL